VSVCKIEGSGLDKLNSIARFKNLIIKFFEILFLKETSNSGGGGHSTVSHASVIRCIGADRHNTFLGK
jgi:hypothetical protein